MGYYIKEEFKNEEFDITMEVLEPDKDAPTKVMSINVEWSTIKMSMKDLKRTIKWMNNNIKVIEATFDKKGRKLN